MPTTKQLATQGRVIMIIQGELHLRGIYDVSTHEVANRMGPRLQEMAEDIARITDEIHHNKYHPTWETRHTLRVRTVRNTIVGCMMSTLGILGIVFGDPLLIWAGFLMAGVGGVVVMAQLRDPYDLQGQ